MEKTKMSVKPITPDEAFELKKVNIPEYVIEIVNRLIIKNIQCGTKVKVAKIKQCDIVAEILKSHQMVESDIYENKMLDFEELYREQGWKVVYDKPGYNETYEATFEFSIGK
jgi:hypothetical protein